MGLLYALSQSCWERKAFISPCFLHLDAFEKTLKFGERDGLLLYVFVSSNKLAALKALAPNGVTRYIEV